LTALAVEVLCVGSLAEDELSSVGELVGQPGVGGGGEESQEGEDNTGHFNCNERGDSFRYNNRGDHLMEFPKFHWGSNFTFTLEDNSTIFFHKYENCENV